MQLVLFEEETAMWLKMYGNVDTWLEIFKKDAKKVTMKFHPKMEKKRGDKK